MYGKTCGVFLWNSISAKIYVSFENSLCRLKILDRTQIVWFVEPISDFSESIKAFSLTSDNLERKLWDIFRNRTNFVFFENYLDFCSVLWENVWCFPMKSDIDIMFGNFMFRSKMSDRTHHFRNKLRIATYR